MNDLGRILRLAGLATEQNVAVVPTERELKEFDQESGQGETNAIINYDYSENWGSIDLYKDGVQVEAWDDYFHSNETGNPLTSKLIELCEKHGIDPEGLKLIDGSDENLDPEADPTTGVFSGGNIHWDKPEQADEAAKPDFRDVDGDGDREESWKDAEEDKDEMDESESDDRDELTKKLFPRKSREDMEKADQERNRAMNQKRFMKPGTPDRSREWGAYESVDTEEEVLDEAAAKIACLGCDEVSTAKAWEKNHGFCPKCKTSSQGVAESIAEASMCESCNESPCTCDCDDDLNESPTMDTTQLINMMHLAGINEEKIKQKLEEWANSAPDAAEQESTSHGEPYENFAQSVNLSLKRYLDAENMKVQVQEHTVENMKALYESKKSKSK